MSRIVFASYQHIAEYVSGTHFVWPDEGRFLPDGDFQFNLLHGGLTYNSQTLRAYTDVKEHEWESFRQKRDHDFMGIRFEPLLIDAQTASVMRWVMDNLGKAENKQKLMNSIAEDRGTFGYWTEKCWQIATKNRKTA